MSYHEAQVPTIVTRSIARLLSESRINVTTEEAAQRGIADTLERASLTFEREYQLDAANRIDLFASGVGIEVKIEGNPRHMIRQLERYAAFDQITGLILATNARWPARGQLFKGKPFAVVNLGKAWL